MSGEIEGLPSADRILANATSFLIQGEEYYEASILLLSRIDVSIYGEWSGRRELSIEIIGSRAIYDIIRDKDHLSTLKIIDAFNAILPSDSFIERLWAKVEFTEYDENWREAFLEVIAGKRSLNQGIPFQEKPRFSWQSLYFRSPVEVTIAKSLDKTGVLFLPNCMTRLGLSGSRENREADFLICYEGKWGILEVNGETFHTSAAKDHDRGRLFKMHNIRVFEPYDARRCINEPDKVVQEFLEILKKNG